MVDVRFSALAAVCTLGVAVASFAGGAWFVAGTFTLLTVGFLARAANGYRSRERADTDGEAR